MTLTAGLVIGVPLAPVAALWTTLTNLIPQIGGSLGGSFFVVLALTEGPVQAVMAAAVFIVYQNLENHVIQPAIVGRAVNLSPPATMLAALVGGAAAGVPGALMATPLIGAAKAVWLDSRGVPAPAEGERIRSARRPHAGPLAPRRLVRHAGRRARAGAGRGRGRHRGGGPGDDRAGRHPGARGAPPRGRAPAP